ncbi:HEAT repeat domain-containing protein [Planctomicrobium sp. SH661]|uniref:HEAT repeat domain-containing protein n=1 Tax=Planctomicrobium sp. SH661 TaxID=3448124 RepID=UPI003F5C3E66
MVRLQCTTGWMMTSFFCTAIAGCGAGAAAPEAPAPRTERVVRAPATDVDFTPAPTEPTVVQVPEDPRARQLFETLIAPGTQLEDWDRTHGQLLEMGESAVRTLAEKLAHGTDAERELAATTLALFGPDASGATSQLLAALDDASPFVQANAAATLVQFPDHAQAAVPTLIKLLQADDPQLRQLAAVNLNAAGTATAGHVESLKVALSQENTADVLSPVVELLGRIGPQAESALPELKKIASEPGELSAAAQSAIQLISGEFESP